MKNELKNPLYFFSIGLILSLTIIPVYAEVKTFNLNDEYFVKGDNIKFSGTVEEDSRGLVTVVIRDSIGEFVLLEQALIQFDDTFEGEIDTSKKFVTSGPYNATAFVLNMTQSKLQSFEFSLDSSSKILGDNTQDIKKESDNIESSQNKVLKEPESKIAGFVDPAKDVQYYIDRYYNEPSYKAWFDKNYPDRTIEEAVGYEPEPSEPESKIAGFVDPAKDVQYYIDRYYNEPSYKAWFDKNYPDRTIEEAVGYELGISQTQKISSLVKEEIIPDAEAATMGVSPIKEANNTELSTMILGIAGLGILFGAVYGIKRKVDDNSIRISHNRDTIRKKLLGSILHNSPDSVIKNRLAKGEISVEEFDTLKKTLNK